MTRKLSNRRSFHSYQSLEPRHLLASIGFDAGEVTVRGDAANDVIELAGSADFQSFTVTINNDPSLTETFQYADVSDVTVIAGDGDDRVNNTLHRSTTIFGGAGNDFIQGGFLDDVLDGGNGNDTLVGRSGNDSIRGESGNDWLYGGPGQDRLFGLADSDRLFGGSGDDLLQGDTGDDALYGQDGADQLIGGQGDDRIFGEAGDDELNGLGGNDVLIGGLGDDVLNGSLGDDLLNGNEGNDRIIAGPGDDTANGGLGDDLILGIDGDNQLNGNGGEDAIYGGEGADEINGGSQDDLLAGGAGEDRLQGRDGVDTLYGGADNDILLGGGGNDFLFGQEGDDNVAGEDGEDIMSGGDGNDLFFLVDNNDRINGGAGVDDVATFFSSQYDYRLDRVGSDIVLTDLRIPDDGFYLGNLTLSSIEQFQVSGEDDPLPIESLLWKSIVERAVVQPIVVSNNDGSNTATAFGTPEQEAEIKRRVDRIYNQVGVDIEFLPTKQWNNTFANGVGEGERDVTEFSEIISRGDAAGVGSSDPLVLDYYFITRVPGQEAPGVFGSGGRAFVGLSGAVQSVGVRYPSLDFGRERIAEVLAHELGHNFGLRHDHTTSPSLLNFEFRTLFLKDFQRTQVIDSGFTRPA